MSYQRTVFGTKIKLKSESILIQFIGLLVRFTNKEFMLTQWLTIFTTTYAPIQFEVFKDLDEYFLEHFRLIIEHEQIHINDFKKYHIWYLLTYLFPPILFAYGRFFWERKAYLPELISLINNHKYSNFNIRLEEICNMLGGPIYLWCWPKSWIRRWFLKKTQME